MIFPLLKLNLFLFFSYFLVYFFVFLILFFYIFSIILIILIYKYITRILLIIYFLFSGDNIKVYYECGACFLRQAKEAIDLSTDDEELKFKLIQGVLSYLGENFSKELSSNATGTRIHQYIKNQG